MCMRRLCTSWDLIRETGTPGRKRLDIDHGLVLRDTGLI